jgi:8-oxo-dGTP diphosphatase
MQQPHQRFGARLRNVVYLDRPGAYAVIFGNGRQFAFVRGKNGWLFLPGGGIARGELSERALVREVIEEIGWTVRILGLIGRATQLVFVEGEGHFAIRAIYLRATLVARRRGQCENEIVWLSAAAATPCLARESDAGNRPGVSRFDSIAERKLRRWQLTKDGNVEISGRDLREGSAGGAAMTAVS